MTALPSRTLLVVLLATFLILPLLLSRASHETGSPSHILTLDKIISDKIQYYNDRYPEIQFMHLDGGEDWRSELMSLLTIIGFDPIAMDYQHPPELRLDVMSATIDRLRQMLEYNIVSATLIKNGQDSIVERPYLCVITLNPDSYVASDRDATRYMLDVSDETVSKMNPVRYLDHIQHLEFTLDHEAFHCLDSYIYGGAPVTHKKLGGEYNLFRRESAADAYAMAMHIRSKQKITNYARNLVHYRALWLFTDSPNRCTFETVREVLKLDVNMLVKMTDDELVDLAVILRDKAVRPYDGYLKQRASALKAAKILGLDTTIYGDEWCECEKIETDPAHVGSLVNRYRFYYDQLFTNEKIPLQAPPLSDVHRH
jgi:hypothetical protein